LKNGKTTGLPNVVAVATAPNYGRFVIGPLEAGIAVPLGNALRRILLSSLPGSAITSVRIQNVFHEFSFIPSVREDVTEIVLNIKNIRLRSYSDRAVRLNLNKHGGGEVRAGDIELPANVELVNPEQVIATLDGDEGQIDMEFTVERGRGYLSSESREGFSIGTIPVDAIFSPVPRVNYIVQPAGEELITEESNNGTAPLDPASLEGRDQVVIEVWTDGTIDPGEALSMAGQVLAQHSSLIANFNRVTAAPPGATPGYTVPAHLFEMSIEELNLSMRTYNCLKRSGITKVGQIVSKDRKELLGLRNFGEKSFDELYDSLNSRELIPEGSPLDVTTREAGAEGEGGEGTEGAEGAEGEEIGYLEDRDADDTADADDVTLVLQGSNEVEAADEENVTGQVADLAGMSEGSAAMAAGIYIDDVPSEGEIETPMPDTHAEILTENDGEIGAEEGPKPKARTKKKS
jgi:DNA-directed RNA polymerase subunit alpha